MDRRTLLAITLCFLIFLGWQKFYLEPRMPQKPSPSATAVTTTAQTQPTATETQKSSSSTLTAQQPKKQTRQEPLRSEELAMGTGIAKIGNGARVFTGWDLKAYRRGVSEEAEAINLDDVTHQPSVVELAFDRKEYAYLSGVTGKLEKTDQGLLWTYEDENVRITRQVAGAVDRNYVDLVFDVQFKKSRPEHAFVSLASQSSSDQEDGIDRNVVYWANKNIERVHLEEKVDLKYVTAPVKWAGVTNRYFLMSLVTNEATGTGIPQEPKALIQPIAPYAARVSLDYPVTNDTLSIPLKVYFGPKELDMLRSVEPTLDHTIDFGWFTIFAYPLLRLMKWFHDLAGNWGVSIILLTILVKIATFPLTYKSMKSMKHMSKLQPQLQRLREKYKDDREALNREMITMMRSHGYNPMAGCLPILVQMPVFFALYRVLYSSIELYHAPFILWIHDLSAKDPYFVTPVLLTIVMYIQQKLTPMTVTDPMQVKMMQWMPVIFGVFMLTLPSGLTLYMLVNAIFSIGQQLFLNKKLGLGPAAPVVPAKA